MSLPITRSGLGQTYIITVTSTVETVFGIVKEAMGFRRFHLRGFDAVQGEWNLVCLTHNLLKLFRRTATAAG